MVKNKLEKLFSKSMKDQFQWGMKLHNNPLAHQVTPADYIVSMKEGGSVYHEHKFMLIECKQVTCKAGKGRLAFKRLKQMHDLIAFQNIHGWKTAFFCIAYYDERWTKSDVYLIPAKEMQIYINRHSYVSLNREDAKQILSKYRVEINGGILQCQSVLQ